MILESPVAETAEEAGTFPVEEQEIVSFKFKTLLEGFSDENFFPFQLATHSEQELSEHEFVKQAFDAQQFDDMSQLNPDVKEFVPVSPTRSNGQITPPL